MQRAIVAFCLWLREFRYHEAKNDTPWGWAFPSYFSLHTWSVATHEQRDFAFNSIGEFHCSSRWL
jgi:hypothetical protein